MNFYIVLGRSRHPIANRLFAESEIEALAKQGNAKDYTFVPVEVPWVNVSWSRSGGQGKSPYPEGSEMTTIRVPKNIAYEAQQYAVWLAQSLCKEKSDRPHP